MSKGKSNILPTILSFFIPGLGQVIKGQILKGIIIFLLVGALYYYVHWIAGAVVWAWNLYDAYTS